MFDSNKIKLFIGHAAKSESKPRLDAMIALAKSEIGIPINTNKLDKNHYLFNCSNGTVNLKTGLLQTHKRSDYLTKINQITYDAEAKCPEWDKFINVITDNDNQLIDYLQRIAGYTLTGDVTEQCLFILYGTGSNGKTTFVETLKKLIGDYSATINIQNIGNTNNNDSKYELARLLNKRLVSASEPERDFKFSESLIKTLTGGDKVSCRFMHCNPFEYYPTFKTFISCNYKPNIRDNDHGIWRRIHLIPFDVRIPKERQDKHLMQKLEKELPGILNWCLKGCLKWQESGLTMSDKVNQATNEYQQEMDIISGFINDCCDINKTFKVPINQLYSHYQSWCLANNIIFEGKIVFGNYLENKGYYRNRDNKCRFFQGLTIKDSNSILEGDEGDK